MAKGPRQPSYLQKPVSHHSSPYPGNEQKVYGHDQMQTPSGGSKKKVPQHEVKHTNPVGRPKNPRY